MEAKIRGRVLICPSQQNAEDDPKDPVKRARIRHGVEVRGDQQCWRARPGRGDAMQIAHRINTHAHARLAHQSSQHAVNVVHGGQRNVRVVLPDSSENCANSRHRSIAWRADAWRTDAWLAEMLMIRGRCCSRAAPAAAARDNCRRFSYSKANRDFVQKRSLVECRPRRPKVCAGMEHDFVRAGHDQVSGKSGWSVRPSVFVIAEQTGSRPPFVIRNSSTRRCGRGPPQRNIEHMG